MAVYEPEKITDNVYVGPGQPLYPVTTQGGSNPNTNTQTPFTSNYDRPRSQKLIAYDVVNNVLNTQNRNILGNFSFGRVGAISIGEYVNGESGEIKISPNGIVGKNVNGEITFSIDGTTGNATFKGTIQAGTVIAGATQVGDESVVLDGTNGRIIVNDGTYDIILIGFQEGGF